VPDAAAPSLSRRVLTAWGDLRGSYRDLLARQPGEGALLALLMAAGLLFTVAGALRLATDPARAADLPPVTAGSVIAAAMILPVGLYVLAMVFYALAMIGHGLARLVGGTATGRESRAAMAWAALVSGPVVLALSVVSVALAPAIGAAEAGGIAQLGSFAFLYAVAVCFADAHGFRRAWPVAAALGAVVVAILAAGAAMADGRQPGVETLLTGASDRVP